MTRNLENRKLLLFYHQFFAMPVTRNKKLLELNAMKFTHFHLTFDKFVDFAIKSVSFLNSANSNLDKSRFWSLILDNLDF